MPKKILRLTLLLAGVLLTGTLGFMIIEGVPAIDAVYMAAISVTTVGFREVFPLSTAGRLFTIGFILTGLGIVFYIAQTLVEDTMEGRIRKILGRRKMEKNIARMSGHVIIAGFGRMGEIVCREIGRLGREFLVIEANPDRFAAAEERNYHVIQGNATAEEILKAAGIDKARIFISLLSDDADNVFTILTARELNPDMLIITRALDTINEKKLLKAGANRVVSPYALSSHRIVRIVEKPNVVDFFDVTLDTRNLSLDLEERTITADSEFVGQSLREATLRERFNSVVVAVRRNGSMRFNPAPDFVFEGGDILILLGERDKLGEIH